MFLLICFVYFVGFLIFEEINFNCVSSCKKFCGGFVAEMNIALLFACVVFYLKILAQFYENMFVCCSCEKLLE